MSYITKLGDSYANSTGGFDLFLGLSGEELGLDNDRCLREIALAKDLEESVLNDVNDGGCAVRRLGHNALAILEANIEARGHI